MKTPCCSKCDSIGFCRPYASCCLECHFAFEEKNASPYLPVHARQWLRSEHARLKAAGYPKEEVQRHALQEMRVFRKYCPAEIVKLIDDDHGEYEHGNLRIRDSA